MLPLVPKGDCCGAVRVLWKLVLKESLNHLVVSSGGDKGMRPAVPTQFTIQRPRSAVLTYQTAGGINNVYTIIWIILYRVGTITKLEKLGSWGSEEVLLYIYNQKYFFEVQFLDTNIIHGSIEQNLSGTIK